MSLSPEQIAERRFLVALRGYDRQEVEEFLKEVAGQVHDLLGSHDDGREADGDGDDAFHHFALQIESITRAATTTARQIQMQAEEDAAKALAAAHNEADERLQTTEQALSAERSHWQHELEQLRAGAVREAEQLRSDASEALRAADEIRAGAAREADAIRDALTRKAAGVRAAEAGIADLQRSVTQELAAANALRQGAEQHAAAVRASAAEEAQRIRQAFLERLEQALHELLDTSDASMTVPPRRRSSLGGSSD